MAYDLTQAWVVNGRMGLSVALARRAFTNFRFAVQIPQGQRVTQMESIDVAANGSVALGAITSFICVRCVQDGLRLVLNKASNNITLEVNQFIFLTGSLAGATLTNSNLTGDPLRVIVNRS